MQEAAIPWWKRLVKCPNIDFFVDRSLIREVGRPGRTRTCYHRLRRPVLYPDELRAHSFHSIAAGLGLVKAFATPEVSSAHHPPMSKFSSPLSLSERNFKLT